VIEGPYDEQGAENVTTRGIDLLALPAGTRLAPGAAAVAGITGLRRAGGRPDPRRSPAGAAAAAAPV
jgi:hypothetical protein